ncbi:pre-60S ribosomal particles component [Elasticomyces elasticus]|nr:pre-60S ribosomal particles component [Elasticomyces elasticus]
MGPISAKRRREHQEELKSRPKKKVRKIKKQAAYHSSSEDDEPTATAEGETDLTLVNLQSSAQVTTAVTTSTSPSPVDDSSENESLDIGDDDEPVLDDSETNATDSSVSDSEADSVASNPNLTKKRKRNDPTAFSTSISRILSTKLTTAKRSDPVLARSSTAVEASRSLANSRLEAKAKRKLRDDKRTATEKGRVKDVLALGEGEEGVSTGAAIEQEKRLKKIAQRGVVKLFNAVRASQVRGEEAREIARREGVVGMGKRDERVGEMSKQGFLELIAGGGIKTAPTEA